MATQLATIADQKSALEKWTPLYLFDVTLKDGVPRRWAKQAVTFAGNAYSAIVLNHSEFRQEGNGVYGVDAVTEIGLTLNNADANLNALLALAVWQGGIIQPRFIFVAPDGVTTTDAIVYPKFLLDLPSATWPRIECSAHNRWNLGRKTLPVSLVTRKDRYPFPDTAAERTAAGSDPSSPFFAIGYDPDTGKGNMKPGGGYYRRFDYDGTREKLREIGLEVRYGGFGKAPPTVVGTPSKGESANYVGNANEAKYGQAVPLVFGTCRIQPVVLDTGFPSGTGGWNGSRLSHYLLSDGVNFAPEHIMGIEDVLDVFIPDSAKFQRIPETSNEPQTTGAWSFQGGYYGSQKAPASSKYRNIDQAIDFPDPLGEFTNRDLYSGLAYLEIGFPKELSGEDGIGPKLEAIVKGLKLEWWDSGGNSDWAWTDNPVWIFVHCLKLLRWTTSEMDKPTIAAAAAYCDGIVPSGKKRFRCNLALMNQTAARDVLRGIRNNCRMYTTFAADGKLQLRIAQNVAGEGGLAFALDNTNIMRGDDGQLLVEKFHRSIYEIANVFSVTFQNEENTYNADSYTKVDVGNLNQIDERISSDSIFPILGVPSFDQAERQMEWARQEQVTLNEYYRVTCSLALIEAKVGQVGTITEPRHGLISQQVRIRAMAPGPDAGTVELTLQKHSDGAYTDNAVETPFTRAQADSSYTPRSVGGMTSASPAPRLTEVTVADPTNADASVRRIRVEFKPPSQSYEGIFSRATKIRDVVVATSGGSIPGGQVLFVEVSPVKAGARGLASEYLMAVVPSGGNSNRISLTCELPPEADQYILFCGNFPGQTYEQLVEPSPGTAPFTISITNLNRNFGSIPPDPQFDHVQIFYTYNSSPNVLRDGGRTSTPDESVIEFEPEAPAAEDTQVTVIVSSANAAEDDFYPINISPKAILTLTYENGPAQGWTATLLPGPTPSSVVAKFTRPTINGKRLFWVAAQIKDSGTGAWRELDDNAGAAVTYYDGSAISHESIGGLKIKKDPGQPVGFGTAHLDDLMMLDVAGGSFDRDRCQWGTVEKFLDDLGAETTAANARYIALTGGLFRPQTTQDLRMKIVKPPHTWTGDGYLGDLSNESINGGVFWEWIGDREGDEFYLKPVEIGRDINSVDVRFWIENDYCRSGGNGTHSNNFVKVRAAKDLVIPGPVQSLVVTGGNGEFVAKWDDPLTGAATIDDVAIQWASDAGFTTIVGTATGWGDVNRLSGTDPGKTYFWRLAAHNLSDQPSHASTVSLGATGWGPWTAYGAPSSVSSGSAGGGPSDSVIPGFLQNLVVSGENGNYIATWLDPATGYLTIDDIAVQWATNPGFTINVGTAKGYGDVNRLSSTSPGTTYYFRLAAHNQSGLTSDSSTFTQLGPTGWGPWTAYGAPTAVASGGIPGAPIDTVIPGPVQNLNVEGINGEFIATWLDPATGNLTIDDTAEQIALDAAFTQGVETYSGWGSRNRLQGTDPGKTYYFRFAVHNQSNQPSHASTAATLGATGWGPWTAYGAAVSSGEVAIGDNTIPPDKFTGAARTEFVETFDDPIGDFWINEGGGVISYPSSGIDGGKVLRVNGGSNFTTNTFKIPYDPRKLYKMTCRVRAVQFIDTTNAKFYMGIAIYDSSGARTGALYPVASAFNAYPAWQDGQWRELTGWFKGLGAGWFQPAPDAANPTPLPTGTVWISPTWAMNWQQAAGAGNIMELDDIRIEILDEQVYQSNAPNGTFGTPEKIVYYPHPDAQSTTNSAVSFIWNYTQGLVKAQQFAITISDGVAVWVERVRALPGTGAQRHQFDVFRLLSNRSLTVTITAEAVAYGGQVPGPTASWGTFTPNAPLSGAAGGTIVGSLDWAGGDVWFESYQYRNGIGPSNGCGSVTIEYFHNGSGASNALISGISYTQGAYFATHLAVVLKSPQGTINLNQDMVVTYFGIATVPATFRVPITLPDNASFTVTVVAVAETAKGRIFNSTFTPVSRGPGLIWLQNSNGPDYRIWLAQQGGQETIEAWRPLRMRHNLEFYTYDTQQYCGRIEPNAGHIVWQNNTGSSFFITPGTYANWGFGTANFGGVTGGHVIGIKDVQGAFVTPPTGGGCLVSYFGGGYWYGPSGSFHQFGPAGPHCSKCGYDFWLIASHNPKWNAYLYVCGWCGAIYKQGPKKVLDLLTKQEQKELIHRGNAHTFIPFALEGESNDQDQRRHKARLYRRGPRRDRKSIQTRVRCLKRRHMDH